MKLFKNQLVKILFRNNTSVEGIVDTWENDNYILKSLDGKTILIIQDPAQDIMAIKVTLEDNPIKNTIPEIPEPIEENINNDLRHKKLAELRIAAITQEKKIIAEKLKSHHISNPMPVKYAIPNIKK